MRSPTANAEPPSAKKSATNAIALAGVTVPRLPLLIPSSFRPGCVLLIVTHAADGFRRRGGTPLHAVRVGYRVAPVTLTRGRITRGRGRLSLIKGGVAPNAGPALVILVVLAVLVGLAGLAGQARGSSQAWSLYLAPASACPRATDPAAPARAQARSLRCLVNWARRHASTPALQPSRGLRVAAVLKGRGVASCGQLSHTPCETPVTDAVRRAGYPFAMFGENLFAGIERHVSARDVLVAWLQSPAHRANVLRPAFQEVGLAAVPAERLLGSGTSVVWVAAFGARR